MKIKYRVNSFLISILWTAILLFVAISVTGCSKEVANSGKKKNTQFDKTSLETLIKDEIEQHKTKIILLSIKHNVADTTITAVLSKYYIIELGQYWEAEPKNKAVPVTDMRSAINMVSAQHGITAKQAANIIIDYECITKKQ